MVELNESSGGQATFFGPPVPIAIPNVAPGVDIQDAEIGGEFSQSIVYSEQPNFGYVNLETGVRTYAANIFLRRAGEFVSLIIVGALLLWKYKSVVEDSVTEIKEKPFQNLLWGLVVLVVYPFLLLLMVFLLVILIILLSFLTLGNLTGTAIQVSMLGMGSILIVVGVIVGLVTKILIGYIVGNWLLEKSAPDILKNKWGDFLSVALGVLIYEIIRAIPLGFGFTIAVLVVLLGTGAIFNMIRAHWLKTTSMAKT